LQLSLIQAQADVVNAQADMANAQAAVANAAANRRYASANADVQLTRKQKAAADLVRDQHFLKMAPSLKSSLTTAAPITNQQTSNISPIRSK